MYALNLVMLVLCTLTLVHSAKRVVVIKDIIDSRAAQRDPEPNFTFDRLQNTQHLFQECLIQHDNKTEPGWTFIEAPLQLQRQRDTGAWTGYLGYIHQDEIAPFDPTIVKLDVHGCPVYDFIVKELVTNVYSRNCGLNGCLEADLVTVASMGTRFASANGLKPQLGWYTIYLLGFTDENAKTRIGYIHASDVNHLVNVTVHPHTLVTQASRMLGWKYFWGGRSTFRMNRIAQLGKLSGVDCSGLTGLLYNVVAAMLIPRDAHDQYLKSMNVTDPSNIQIGDLFFFRGITTERITHVMMYIGDNQLVESTAFSNSTRIVSISDRFCVDRLDQLRWEMVVCEGKPDKQQSRIKWGRYLTPKDESPAVPLPLMYVMVTTCVIFLIGSLVAAISLGGRYCYMKAHSEERKRLKETKKSSYSQINGY
jgi:cell wall-associated NlpC family hydrolase